MSDTREFFFCFTRAPGNPGIPGAAPVAPLLSNRPPEVRLPPHAPAVARGSTGCVRARESVASCTARVSERARSTRSSLSRAARASRKVMQTAAIHWPVPKPPEAEARARVGFGPGGLVVLWRSLVLVAGRRTPPARRPRLARVSGPGASHCSLESTCPSLSVRSFVSYDSAGRGVKLGY